LIKLIVPFKKKYFRLLLIFLILLLPVGAAAHAELKSAVPSPGARLSEQPEEIRLTFSEEVGQGSSITLFGEGFREVEGLEAVVDGERPADLIAAVPELAPGTYSVNWRVLSTDVHPAAGSYTFAFLPETERGFPIGIVALAAAVVLGLGAGWQKWKKGRSA
jgi:methionine-rich copper-binding protein CopC